jgi:7-cyano-7-deazaguanine synthase in queuosine biosynthesis
VRSIDPTILVRQRGGNWYRLAPHGRDAEAWYSSRLRSSFGPKLSNPVANDLFRVGQAGFLADRFFKRAMSLGQRTRFLEVKLPVSNASLWKRVASLVEDLAGFASRDRWTFQFRTEKSPATAVPDPNPELTVSLFSDGLDSLCGAAAIFAREETPVFVSHNPPGFATAKNRIDRLLKALNGKAVSVQFANFDFKVDPNTKTGTRSLFSERTRLTRPFLYLCLAGAVAIELGARKIILNENGVLAVNLPISPGRTGIDVTRHAHPYLLRRFQELLTRLVPSEWTVENPFSNDTKGEELKYLEKATFLIDQTSTCHYARQLLATFIGRMRKAGHKLVDPPKGCGICLACIVRRAATKSQGIVERRSAFAVATPYDLKKRKYHGVASLFRWIEGDASDLLEFWRRLAKSSLAEFSLNYLPEIELLVDHPDRLAAELRRVYALYRRAGKELLHFLAHATS